MTLFKASLWSSVLTLCGLTLVSAAPQSLLAGRVPSDGDLELLRNIQSLRPFLSQAGLPAFSLVRALPTVNSFPAVPQSQRLSQPALSPLPPVPAVVTNLDPVEAEAELPARYNFGYSVADLESGDSKSRQESRDGDLVTGSYSVADPDGRIRTVTYTADSEHGFQAKVTYDGEEGPVAIPFNKPTETVQVAEPVVIAKDIEEPQSLVQLELQPQPEPAVKDVELSSPEEKSVQPESPSLFTNSLSLASPVPTVFPSVTRVNNIPSSHTFSQWLPANSPRFVSSVPRLVTSLPGLFNQLRAVPSLQALLHNNLHPVQALPHAVHQTLPRGVAVRAGAAPLDLSQFTFLSNGQVVG